MCDFASELENIVKQYRKTTIFNCDMEKQLFLVYGIKKDGSTTEKRVTDREHLEKCAKYVKHDFNVAEAHYNKAAFCFDGYLVQGDYQGTL